MTDQENLNLIYGIHTCNAQLKLSPKNIKKIYLKKPPVSNHLTKIMKDAENLNVEIVEVEKDFLTKLLEVSEAVRYLPGANQASLTSLWTPNVRVLRVTEEGYEATAVIPGNIIPEDLNESEIQKIKEIQRCD